MSARGRFSSWVVVGYMVSALCAGRALADPPTTKAPFIYETSKFGDSSEDPDFLARFDDAAPELLHLRSVFRFLGRYGVGGRVLDAHTEDYEEFSPRDAPLHELASRQGRPVDHALPLQPDSFRERCRANGGLGSI